MKFWALTQQKVRWQRYWKKPDGRYNAIVIGFVILLAISFGCAVSLANRPARGYSYRLLFNDEIFAIAPVDNITIADAGTGSVVALLGKQQSYLLTQGGDKLLQVAQSLKDKPLQWVTEDRASRIIVENAKIRGRITLRYSPDTRLTASSREELLKIGFIPSADHQGSAWNLQISIGGIMSSPVPFSPAQLQTFKHQYPVTVSYWVRKAAPEQPAKITALPLVWHIPPLPSSATKAWLPLLALQGQLQ